MSKSFRVALTADFFEQDGTPTFADMGTSVFASHPWIETRPFTEHRPEIVPDQHRDANAIIVLSPRVTTTSVAEADDLLAVGRFGVGYDTVDLPACTKADVLAFIAAGAVDRSMAEATVGWMIALGHHIRSKDQLVRSGQWDDRTGFLGSELRDHTFGAVGLGGIARKTVELLSGFGMNPPIAFDPYVEPQTAAGVGVQLVALEHLMAEADFVSVHCPLTDSTRNLIGTEQIGLMKPSAFLLNTARGGIVDEDALFEALKTGRIGGAALDCFVSEPVRTPHRFGQLDNVLLAPHCIGWTQELFRDVGRAVCQGMVDLARGKVPRGVINPEVLERAGFQEKWKRLQVGADCVRNKDGE